MSSNNFLCPIFQVFATVEFTFTLKSYLSRTFVFKSLWLYMLINPINIYIDEKHLSIDIYIDKILKIK